MLILAIAGGAEAGTRKKPPLCISCHGVHYADLGNCTSCHRRKKLSISEQIALYNSLNPHLVAKDDPKY